MYEIELPYPPSVNHYWILCNNRKVLGKKGRIFREAIVAKYATVEPVFTTEVEVEIVVTLPDRRKRDIDNILKPILDALEHANVLENDRLVASLHVWRKPTPVKPGSVKIIIKPWELNDE